MNAFVVAAKAKAGFIAEDYPLPFCMAPWQYVTTPSRSLASVEVKQLYGALYTGRSACMYSCVVQLKDWPSLLAECSQSWHSAHVGQSVGSPLEWFVKVSQILCPVCVHSSNHRRQQRAAVTCAQQLLQNRHPASRILNDATPLERRLEGNTARHARHARRSDEARGVCVSVARIAPSLLDLGRGVLTEIERRNSNMWKLCDQLWRHKHLRAPGFGGTRRQVIPLLTLRVAHRQVLPQVIRRSRLAVEQESIDREGRVCEEGEKADLAVWLAAWGALVRSRHTEQTLPRRCVRSLVFIRPYLASLLSTSVLSDVRNLYTPGPSLISAAACWAVPAVHVQASRQASRQHKTERRWNAMLGERENPEKTRRQAASSSTIPIRKNPGVNQPEIEPGSPWWEASALATAASTACLLKSGVSGAAWPRVRRRAKNGKGARFFQLTATCKWAVAWAGWEFRKFAIFPPIVAPPIPDLRLRRPSTWRLKCVAECSKHTFFYETIKCASSVLTYEQDTHFRRGLLSVFKTSR
ncbi:hypothetical protein PR048_014827 [Dryococelus australis]|uniref:Uncharacterized protein n=1 Tax=Dryococelus australis TaxID=614101 RepID=A0ABQ9HF92_9NEOP|nr:hypothetical protein PR048_014827 [Dryococelus australis]